ncbi:hypothetical protein H2248_000698 [Termitomyces sp. 'cryptogamus']|nr:hypothetical protein H2248_000698 [Termitomyces sp. 'cryptogamus']
MLPQNGQLGQTHSQPNLSSFMAPNPTFDASSYFNNMDPTQAAKQMAALSAASQARIANTRPTPFLNSQSGTNSAPSLGGTNPPGYLSSNYDLSSGSSTQQPTFQMPNNHPPSTSPSLIDPMSQSIPRTVPPANGTNFAQRRQGFLTGLANVMSSMGTPLPPALTGVPSPNFDPNSSRWKHLELSSEIGTIRLAGRDVGLFQLWGIVFRNGGGQAVTDNNGWSAILPQFGLPEEVQQRGPNLGTIQVAQLIASLYMTMIYPFEQYYKNNLQEQQKRVRQAGSQGSADFLASNRLPSSLHATQVQRGPLVQPTSVPSTANGSSSFPPSSAQRPESAPPTEFTPDTSHAHLVGLSNDSQSNSNLSDGNVLDQEVQGIKRKVDYDNGDGKRARQKTEPPSENSTSAIPPAVDRSSSATMSGAVPASMQAPRPRQQPSRRKIEYVPLAREVDTYGGRDLNLLENEPTTLPQRRPIRDVSEWGTVDIEALTMSIRSRLAAELSYALTTLTLLSTMRGATPGSGFPLVQAPELFDEVLDLLEEQAFAGSEDSTLDLSHIDPEITTHRDILTQVCELENQPFAVLVPSQGSKDPKLGPLQRPGDIVLAITNIIRNLSTVHDNFDFLSRHTRLIDLMLRLCTVTRGEHRTISPASSALSLGDLIRVRRDVLYTLSTAAPNIQLSTSSPRINLRMATRSFHLISSYLVDPIEAVPPMTLIQLVGIPPSGNPKPPGLADIALEVFSRLSQLDSNRQIYSKHIPQGSLMSLFEALVHRLPVVDADFQLMVREPWLSYMEKIVIVIYSLAFLAPPELKQKLKANRALGFRAVMWRLVQKLLMNHEMRGHFTICSKRAVEAMKVLDDAEDCFDTSKSTAPIMSFGMGYGEVGDNSSEKGTGLLGGHRGVTWEVLMLHEVAKDEVFFGELESLSRVEC